MEDGTISAVGVDTSTFWEAFYDEAEGRRAYEWYVSLRGDGSAEPAALEALAVVPEALSAAHARRPDGEIVAIDVGCGNSLAFERLLSRQLGRARPWLRYYKLDYASACIEQLRALQCRCACSQARPARSGGRARAPRAKRPSAHGEPEVVASEEDNDTLSWLATATVACGDAGEMEGLWPRLVEAVDVVFDKGCLDALLSSAEDVVQGELEQPLHVVRSVHRMLTPGGLYVVVSRNDQAALLPYFFGCGDDATWDGFEQTVLSGRHTTYVYKLRKNP
eukprot:NODE_12758_length_1205_cov_8.489796.p1 GENE.NODE_12758_length_1205_cov_8.489796~~NODE_12758_length_1205_cov_8.489796.p1  ORF type:complete len:278 (-),score=49.91 NODE_12758_length_1205_cov_8.489796:233-1066(-)